MGRSTYVEGLALLLPPLAATLAEPHKELGEGFTIDGLCPSDLAAQVVDPVQWPRERVHPPGIGVVCRQVEHFREDLFDLVSNVPVPRSGPGAGPEEGSSSMVAESLEDLLLILHVSTANLTV